MSISRWAPGLAVLLLACGCGSLDLNLSRGDRDVRAVKEIVCLWEAAEGVGLDGLPTRGFAGQLLFFRPGSDEPVLVDGDVKVYVFDDQGTIDEQSRPLHEFEFPGAVWRTFARETNLGPAYQIFVPYTRKGHNYANCAIRVRFTAEGQLPVYSKMANIALPGRRVAGEEANDATAEQVREKTASEPAAPVAEIDALELPMPTIPQLDRLHRAAADAVKGADDVAGETMPDETETDAVASRRYQMTGRIQQTSGVGKDGVGPN
jgi:hypothetical protein